MAQDHVELVLCDRKSKTGWDGYSRTENAVGDRRRQAVDFNDAHAAAQHRGLKPADLTCKIIGNVETRMKKHKPVVCVHNGEQDAKRCRDNGP